MVGPLSLRRALLPIVAVAALVLGVLSPLPGGVTPADASVSSALGGPSAVPAPKVTPVSTVKVEEPAGDFSERSATLAPPKIKTTSGHSFDAASAAVTDRSEFSDTSTDKNGQHQVTMSQLPINVNSGGKWQPSQTSVSDAPDGLEDALHPLKPKFAANASDAKLLQVSNDGTSLSFRLKGAEDSAVQHPVIPIVNTGADQVTYPSVFSNTDLRYQVAASLVKEAFVLNQQPDQAPVYTWIATARGVSPVQDDFGDLLFEKPDGTVEFTMPVPAMWDSSGEDGVRQPVYANVPYTVTQVAADQWAITLTPSADWLDDSSRVYPVTIDPSVTPGPDNNHGYKSDGTQYTGSFIYTGNTRQSNKNVFWRDTVHYNYEQLFGTQLTGAYYNTGYYAGTANCYGMWIYWAQSFTYANTNFPYMGSMTNCNSSAQSGDIGAYVNEWINNGWGGSYLWLQGDESSNYTYKADYSTMTFYYVSEPSISSISGPVNGARASIQPTFTPSASDPTGGGLSFDYQYSERVKLFV